MNTPEKMKTRVNKQPSVNNLNLCNILIFIMLLFFALPVKAADKAAKAVAPVPDNPVQMQSDQTQMSQLQPVSYKYEYDPAGRRDPFMSTLDINKRKRTESEEGKPKRALSPLELQDISTIKLIAILSDGKKTYAGVTLPDGRSFTLRVGTPIGLNDGRVADIKSDRVIIKESTTDPYGRPVTREIEMRLRKEEQN